MKYHEFIGQVQHRARLASEEDAVRAVRVTLETLGERLFGGEPGNLAAQLPQEIGLHLTRAQLQESFPLDEFFRRISLREGVDLPTAVFHARVVMEVLAQAVSPGSLRKALEQLPPEYDQFILSATSEQPGMP